MLAACVLLTLAGCGQRTNAPDLPHAPSSLTPRFYAPRGWTWGAIKLPDGQSVRYGVASPPVVPRGHVLVLPDRNEPAEVWFETLNDLNDRGFTTWVLEAADAKGAGALSPTQGAVQAMVGSVIRPTPKQPVAVIGQGLGATVALRAMAEGRAPGVRAALLASPALDQAGIDMNVGADQVATAAEWASRARAGWIELPGDGQPRLTHITPVGLDPKRAGLAATWRRADPSLKPRKTTLGWVWGYDQAIQAARSPSSYSGPTPKVTLAATASDDQAIEACKRLSTCTLWAIPASAPHLARDELRREWLSRVDGLFDASVQNQKLASSLDRARDELLVRSGH